MEGGLVGAGLVGAAPQLSNSIDDVFAYAGGTDEECIEVGERSANFAATVSYVHPHSPFQCSRNEGYRRPLDV